MIRLNEKEKQLVQLLSEECSTPAEITAKLKNLFAGTIEKILEAELDEHLGYEKNEIKGNNSGNSRNGHGDKTIKSEWGESEISIPRDRNGSFEPRIVGKRQTRTDDIETRVLAMYAKGMSTRDIEDHLRDIYGVDASASLISRITDKIMPEVAEWQSRPLAELYPVVFFDGIWFKVKKDAKVVNKCVYTVLGIDMDGKKDILGIWISDSESASFWTTVFNELRNRGVKDILIACHDNLSGFSNALATVFPKTDNQLCIIHMIRNSTKYVSHRELKQVMADLKKIYGAVSEEAALNALVEFKEKWHAKYPQIYKSWEANWADLSGFFKYPPEMRRLIYTTNAVEGFHRMLRKFTKNKTNFPTDDSLRKSIYLSVKEISKKWTMPIKDWGIIIGQFLIFFEDRFAEVRIA
jgi:putative transposase